MLPLIFLSGCMQKVEVVYVPRQVEPVVNEDAEVSLPGTLKTTNLSCEQGAGSQRVEELQNYFESWHGVRYRYGGVTTKGVDCSGLILRTYKDLYHVDLPRTVVEQARRGKSVQKKSLRPGDLIFFKTGLFSRHVGIYLGDDAFIHASRSKGVIQSSLKNPYWRTKYWKAKRLQLASS